jgi:hypothetical protein
MTFSHRDLRAHREVGRLAGIVVAALVGLVAVALLAPGPIVGALTVLALAGLGAYAMARGNVLVHRYQNDLRSARAGTAGRLGAVGAEVHSVVPFGPAVPSPARRSPHVRRPGRRDPLGDLGGPVVDPVH